MELQNSDGEKDIGVLVDDQLNTVSIQNKENTGNHTEISCIKVEVDVDIVAESQRPQMT